MRQTQRVKELPVYNNEVIRWIEFILCVACLVFAIFLQYYVHWLSALLLIPVAAVFAVITGALVLVNHLLRPIPLRTWLLISVSGCILFLACGILCILSYAQTLNLIYILLAAIFNFVTAIVLLIDFIYGYLLYNKLRRLGRTNPLRANNNVDVAILATEPPRASISVVRTPSRIIACGDNQPNQYIRRSASRIAPACGDIPITHGGTFPIGNDLTPVISEGCRRTAWSESNATNTSLDDVVIKGTTKYERKRSHASSCSAPPPVSVKGQCVRYAIKISPSKISKLPSSLKASPRAITNKPESDGCGTCHCLPGEVHVIEEHPAITPTCSNTNTDDRTPRKPEQYLSCKPPEETSLRKSEHHSGCRPPDRPEQYSSCRPPEENSLRKSEHHSVCRPPEESSLRKSEHSSGSRPPEAKTPRHSENCSLSRTPEEKTTSHPRCKQPSEESTPRSTPRPQGGCGCSKRPEEKPQKPPEHYSGCRSQYRDA